MYTPPSNAAQTSSASGSPASYNQTNAQKEDKPRLTDQQKKANHISSEQNRRNLIREQFDRLSEIVPGTRGKARSEAVVLEKMVDYGKAQVEEGQRMIEEIERMGGMVDPDTRAKFFIPGRGDYPHEDIHAPGMKG